MLVATLALAIAQSAPPIDTVAPPRLLFLTHSAGFEHDVVKRARRAVLAHAERCMVDWAGPMFEVEATQECSALHADNLGRYQAVMFYTTGELPISDGDKAALLQFVRDGGGFVGVHCASDTFYTYPEYGEMVGGYFDGHPWHQEVRVEVEDRAHPTTFHLGHHFDIADEIYQFRAFDRTRVHVLLRLSAHGIDLALGKRQDKDYAISWCREFGKGRVFYTALGHRPEVWRDARFMTHLLAGVRWTLDGGGVLGRAPAGATVLVQADGTHSLQGLDGKELAWKVHAGALEVVPGSTSAVSPRAYGDLRVHAEFQVPRDDHRGNSGVYLQRRYEVQILDSAGRAAETTECSALYGARAPDFNASLAPGTWQSFDIWFRAARFEGDKKVADARVTVVHNGILVHRDVSLAGPTGQGIAEGPQDQPLLLQEHGSAVRWRNVWVSGW
jgi:hypothetical protein